MPWPLERHFGSPSVFAASEPGDSGATHTQAKSRAAPPEVCLTLPRARLQSVQGLLDVSLPHAKDVEIKATSGQSPISERLSLPRQAWKDQRGRRMSQAKRSESHVLFEASGGGVLVS